MQKLCHFLQDSESLPNQWVDAKAAQRAGCAATGRGTAAVRTLPHSGASHHKKGRVHEEMSPRNPAQR